MNALIQQIQNALEHGRPHNVQTGPVAAQIIKEIQKQVLASKKDSSLKSLS